MTIPVDVNIVVVCLIRCRGEVDAAMLLILPFVSLCRHANTTLVASMFADVVVIPTRLVILSPDITDAVVKPLSCYSSNVASPSVFGISWPVSRGGNRCGRYSATVATSTSTAKAIGTGTALYC